MPRKISKAYELLTDLSKRLETKANFFPESISDKDKENLILISEEVVGIAEHMRCQFIHKSNSSLKKEDVFEKYVDDDKVTLQDIAPLHGVTRERIRQLYNNIRKRYRGFFLKLLRKNDEFLPEIQRLCELFEAADHAPVAIVYCGLERFSKKRLKFSFALLFGEDLTEALFSTLKAVTKMNKTKKSSKTEKNSSYARQTILDKAFFPAAAITGLYTEVQSYDKGAITNNVSFFYRLRENKEIEIIEYPDIIYYTSSTTEHRPSFLIRTADDKAILGLIVPVMNMPIFYNIARFNALHSFCKSKGCGYLILDKTGRSIFEIKNADLPEGLEEDLNTILEVRGEIVWSDIKALKETYPITQEIVAAYILKNKLHFVQRPYRIRRIK